MNYLKEVVKFSELVSVTKMSTTAQALWYALMYMSNTINWRRPVAISTRSLAAYVHTSQTEIVRARDKLVELGFIKVITHDRSSSFYEMVSLAEKYKHKQYTGDTEMCTEGETSIDTSRSTSIDTSRSTKMSTDMSTDMWRF